MMKDNSSQGVLVASKLRTVLLRPDSAGLQRQELPEGLPERIQLRRNSFHQGDLHNPAQVLCTVLACHYIS